MFLSDMSIKRVIESGSVVITPFNPENIQSNSYLLTVRGNHIVNYLQHINVWTKEYIEVPTCMLGILTARTSIARKGMFFTTSIGIDAGFKGNLVIEFFNVNREPFILNDGDKIVHLLLALTTTECTPYSGKYQGQRCGSGLENISDNR